MTPLARILIARIKQAGPIPVSEYMAECLLHPEHGYYTMREVLGRAGDFTTAPEISQMFGELLGLALAQSWLDQGAPKAFTLAELGPGRGTLMADAMRASKGVPGFHDAMSLWLVEASPIMRAAQLRALTGYAPNWADAASELPAAPLFLLANEFFDALPIRQFIRQGAGWSERLVGLKDGGLSFGFAPPAAHAALAHRLADTREGDMVETCAPAAAIISEVAARIKAHGGAALLVDYGGWRSLGDTLQAVQNHAYTEPLAAPGMADLTAHVDFEALAGAAQGVRASQLTPQGEFLKRLGIEARAKALARNLSGAALATHTAALHRLTDAAEMGTLFKVMGLTPQGAPPVPGTDNDP